MHSSEPLPVMQSPNESNRLYTVWVLARSAFELIGRNPLSFGILTITLMANEHAMEILRWTYPRHAWVVDVLCVLLWPVYFVVTCLCARYAHFGFAGLKFPIANIGRAIRYLVAPVVPIAAVAVIPAYFAGVPALNPLVGVAFALVAAAWMWAFTPLGMLLHSLSNDGARAYTQFIRANRGGVGLKTILLLLLSVCAVMLLMERSLWASFIGPLAFVLVVTSVYCAYTLAAEYRPTAPPAPSA